MAVLWSATAASSGGWFDVCSANTTVFSIFGPLICVKSPCATGSPHDVPSVLR